MKKTKEYLENRIKKLTDERKKCVSKYNSNSNDGHTDCRVCQ